MFDKNIILLRNFKNILRMNKPKADILKRLKFCVLKICKYKSTIHVYRTMIRF